MNVLIVNTGYGYDQMFEKRGFSLCSDMQVADLVCFTGGSDVTPALYGDKAHYTTGASAFRDAQEMAFYERALKAEIPMVGVCRGGQFLNVMSGGRMYQDVDEHCGDHEIIDRITGETILVSSTHHQMMMPSPEGLLVASSNLGGRREWFDKEVARRDVSKEDIEVVYYAHTNSLCFQPHPEFASSHYSPMTDYFFKCMERFLDVQVEALAA